MKKKHAGQIKREAFSCFKRERSEAATKVRQSLETATHFVTFVIISKEYIKPQGL